MTANKFYYLTIFSILAVLGYLSYQIIQPFFIPIAWAIVFCVVFYPVYAFLLRRIKVKAVASLITLLLILIVIIGPFSYISFALINELSDFVGNPVAARETLDSLLADERVVGLIERFQPYTGLEGSSEDIVIENLRKGGRKIIENLTTGFTNVLGVGVNFIFMAFAIFFLLRDGHGFLLKIRDYLPFSEQQEDRLTSQMKDMIVSTIYGGVIVAIVQGIVGGLAFWILGIGSPIFWGSAMAVVSFVPMVGTSIIWAPASIILLVQGAFVKAIALVIVGIFVIGTVDNVLRPLIIGGRTKMPTVIIFFTVLGGIKLFGLLGIVMGPLVFAMFLSVFEIFRAIEGGSDA